MLQVINAIINAVMLFLQKLISMVLMTTCSALLDNSSFTPSKDYFIEMLGGAAGNGEANLENIMLLFRGAGIFIAIAILAFHLFLTLNGTSTELKDSVQGLLLKFGVSFVLIFLMPVIANAIMSASNTFYNTAVVSVIGGGSNGDLLQSSSSEALVSSSSLLDNISNQLSQSTVDIETGTVAGSDDDDTSPNYATWATTAAQFLLASSNPVLQAAAGLYGIIVLLTQLILYGVLVVQTIKLAFEIVKHYITMMALFISSPMFASFYTSTTTQSVMFSYLQMYALEIGLLIGTKVWCALLLLMMGSFSHGIMGLMAMIAWAKVGLSLTNMLKGLGLSTANTGGALFDTVAVTAGTMAMAASGMKKSAGGALISAGGAANSAALGAMGNGLLGRGFDKTAGYKAAQATFAGQMRQKKDKGAFGSGLRDAVNKKAAETDSKVLGAAASAVNKTTDALNGKANTTIPNSTKQMLDENLWSNRSAFSDAYGKLSPKQKEDYLSHLQDTMLGADNPLGLTAGLEHAGVKDGKLDIDPNYDYHAGGFHGTLTDANGAVANVTLSAQKSKNTVGSMQTTDGQDLYLDFDSWETSPSGSYDCAVNKDAAFGDTTDGENQYKFDSIANWGNDGVSDALSANSGVEQSSRLCASPSLSGGTEWTNSSTGQTLAHVENNGAVTTLDSNNALYSKIPTENNPSLYEQREDGMYQLTESAIRDSFNNGDHSKYGQHYGECIGVTRLDDHTYAATFRNGTDKDAKVKTYGFASVGSNAYNHTKRGYSGSRAIGHAQVTEFRDGQIPNNYRSYDDTIKGSNQLQKNLQAAAPKKKPKY